MTLYETLMDVGKGRFIDNGCDYELIALAKGTYIFTNGDYEVITITVNGKQGENARTLEKQFDKIVEELNKNAGTRHGDIIDFEYKKI